ncbi:protein of unknown function [Azospirillum baldaniorum]|uniref:Uncharacterized protein n=1 Tax=Azospirillum baldaniorum TaxID=1064539 RepID=A0A9P1NMF1_9PROT|nr:protein of unknown function [Azospirillum baldaniorum]
MDSVSFAPIQPLMRVTHVVQFVAAERRSFLKPSNYYVRYESRAEDITNGWVGDLFVG